MVGHVNKEGGIAGPKILEHMVDAVLSFEGEKLRSYRIIRAVKNRFGSVSEIGMFEMSDTGIEDVANPSETLLAGRPQGVSGNCAVCVMEGTRPIIAEVQALVAATSYPAPRRTSNGIDYNRMCLILAVLEKRLGYRFSVNDVYLNVIGGLRIDEPAADLSVATSLLNQGRTGSQRPYRHRRNRSSRRGKSRPKLRTTPKRSRPLRLPQNYSPRTQLLKKTPVFPQRLNNPSKKHF